MDLKAVEKQMEFYAKLKAILTMVPRNDTEALFLKYIELRRTPDVAKYLNECGLRTKGVRGDRLFISTDITAMLDDPSAEGLVDPVAYNLVKRMQKSGMLLQKHVLEIMSDDEAGERCNKYATNLQQT